MRNLFLTLLSVPFAAFAAGNPHSDAGPSSGVYDVRDYGARGDGITKDTAAIQKAVDAAHASGGGEVFLGAGTYLSGSVFLKSNVDFHLGAGAVLKGSPDKEDYNAVDVCPQNSASVRESASGAHLLLCIEQENVTVRGPGRIDGNSAAFLVNPATSRTWGYTIRCQSGGVREVPWRPSQMLYFVESRNIRVTDIELVDSTYWTLFIHGCEHVLVRGAYIHNERDRFHTYNGDGIDIDSSMYVTVSDCRIRTADDCITLRANSAKLKKKRDCAFITVSNCILSSACNCVRVGVGQGLVHDAVFSGITVHDARTAINFVSAWNAKTVRGVEFRDIQFVNWTVDCRELLKIYAGPVASGVKRVSSMRNILFSGFSGSSFKGGSIQWIPSCPAEGVEFRDMNVPVSIEVENADVKIDGGSLRLASTIPVFDVRDHGARGDGKAKDTVAIQKAVDAAHAAGGGKVIFGVGTYLAGTVFMKSGVELIFEKGAVLKGSPDREDYCKAEAFPQNYASVKDNMSGGHLIVAAGCRNIALRGPGRIDGSSAAFLVDADGAQYKGWKKGVPWRPGQMIYIVDSRNVVIEGLEMVNSPYWTCFLLNSEKVLVANCRIRTERKKYRTWNGDGIDIDRCSNVYVTGCDIDTEDDSVTLRASCASRLANPQDCRNVKVTRCRLSSACNAVRIGVGEGVIRDCSLSFLDIHNTATAINIISAYTKESRGTDIRDIALYAINAECRQFLNMGYGRTPGHAKDAVISDIVFKDAIIKADRADNVREEPNRPFRNLVLPHASGR